MNNNLFKYLLGFLLLAAMSVAVISCVIEDANADSGKTDAEVMKQDNQWQFKAIGHIGGATVYLVTDPDTQCQYIMQSIGGITPRNYSDQVQVCNDPRYDGEFPEAVFEQ